MAGQNLFGLPDFHERADEIKALRETAEQVAGVFGFDVGEDWLKKSADLCTDLARTRAEQLLARLFSPDAMAKYSMEDRDTKTRGIKQKQRLSIANGALCSALCTSARPRRCSSNRS